MNKVTVKVYKGDSYRFQKSRITSGGYRQNGRLAATFFLLEFQKKTTQDENEEDLFMARPKKPESVAKTVMATFRLTHQQAESFRQLSNEIGMSKSQLARAAAIGMKKVYITDGMVEEARELSRQVSLVGNLLRLHATLLETISLNPSLAPSDREEIVRIRELLALSVAEIKNTRQAVIGLRTELRKLTNGNL